MILRDHANSSACSVKIFNRVSVLQGFLIMSQFDFDFGACPFLLQYNPVNLDGIILNQFNWIDKVPD